MPGMTDADRQMIAQTHSTIMLVHTSLEKVEGDMVALKTDVTSLGNQMTDVRELIDPDKIKNPKAKGMLDVDAEHSARLGHLEAHVSQCPRGVAVDPTASSTSIEKPDLPQQVQQAGVLSALTPQQQLIALVLGIALLVGGAGAERVINRILPPPLTQPDQPPTPVEGDNT